MKLNNTKLRDILIKEERKKFIIHLAAYIIFIPFMTVLNIMFTPEKIWFIWPLIGWGSGVIIHYIFGVLRYEKHLLNLEFTNNSTD